MTHDKEDFSAADIAEWLGVQPEPSPAGPQDGIGHFAARMRDALHALAERHRLRRELEMLEGSHDLDRVLAEAQLTRGEVETMLANYPASRERLAAMAARLGVTAAMARDQPTARDMQHVCSVCADQGRCKHWLDSGATEGFEAFCPNAETLKALRHADN